MYRSGALGLHHQIIGRSTLAMGKKKRKQEKLRGDSSSSADAKRRRRSCCQDDGPSDSERLEGSDSNVLIQLLRDSIQVNVNTDERLRKLKRRLKNMKKKYRVLKEGLEGHTKELIDEAKEDLRKEMADRVDEQLKLKLQELQYDASSSERSPPHQSQTTRFRLGIKSTVSKVIYKGEDIRTDDGRDEIHVILYDGGSEIAPDHRLASVEVQLVVVKAEFNERCQGLWSKEEFKKSLQKPRGGITWLVKDGRFPLVGGKGSRKGAVIIENSKRKDVKLGVMIVGDTQERVLEGLSNTFRVQEAKTKKREKSKEFAAKDTLHKSSQRNQMQENGLTLKGNVQPYFPQTQPMQNGLVLNTNVQPYFPQTQPMQHEREKSKELATEDTLHNLSQLNHSQGNGLAQNVNSQPYNSQTQPMQHGQGQDIVWSGQPLHILDFMSAPYSPTLAND